MAVPWEQQAADAPYEVEKLRLPEAGEVSRGIYYNDKKIDALIFSVVIEKYGLRMG